MFSWRNNRNTSIVFIEKSALFGAMNVLDILLLLFFSPSEKGSTLQGKILLPEEEFLLFTGRQL